MVDYREQYKKVASPTDINVDYINIGDTVMYTPIEGRELLSIGVIEKLSKTGFDSEYWIIKLENSSAEYKSNTVKLHPPVGLK
uniref:Uncharacterized protein n=1 Tax=uncultured marine virus TaxID=186617 RepID=A0A0F7L4I0_9VIRU|nr:hypothetical protein [uncultured marine virus]